MKQGQQMHRWAQDLWPINRSLTGAGVRETLTYLKQLMPPLQIKSIDSGTRVCDWTIPQEWLCRDAYIITPDGRRICDFNNNNLHLVGYSYPIDTRLSLQQLQEHLYTDPEQPDAIPYVTSYYTPHWGFCISQNDYDKLSEGEYHVVIDSELFDGELNYADMLIEGKSDKEILFSTYVCHPSMANNELSGPVVVAALTRWLLENQNRLNYSYRIVYTPETIGAIAYIHLHQAQLQKNVVAGYQVTTVGDDRSYSYVASPYADTVSDEVAQQVLQEMAPGYRHYSFLHRGSDERQYCSPNLRLPIASICRTKYGEYPEYHTSADNLTDVVTAEGLQGAYDVYIACIRQLESRQLCTHENTREQVAAYPRQICVGEPQLGRRNLYNNLSYKGSASYNRLMINILTYCDGSNSPAAIAALVKCDLEFCENILQTLCEHRLVTRQKLSAVPKQAI